MHGLITTSMRNIFGCSSNDSTNWAVEFGNIAKARSLIKSLNMQCMKIGNSAFNNKFRNLMSFLLSLLYISASITAAPLLSAADAHTHCCRTSLGTWRSLETWFNAASEAFARMHKLCSSRVLVLVLVSLALSLALLLSRSLVVPVPVILLVIVVFVEFFELKVWNEKFFLIKCWVRNIIYEKLFIKFRMRWRAEYGNDLVSCSAHWK